MGRRIILTLSNAGRIGYHGLTRPEISVRFPARPVMFDLIRSRLSFGTPGYAMQVRSSQCLDAQRAIRRPYSFDEGFTPQRQIDIG